MGLAGVRNADNMVLFEAKKPLVVAYYSVDYTHNPKGSNYWRNRCVVCGEVVGRVVGSEGRGKEDERRGEEKGAEREERGRERGRKGGSEEEEEEEERES